MYSTRNNLVGYFRKTENSRSISLFLKHPQLVLISKLEQVCSSTSSSKTKLTHPKMENK